LEGGVLFAYLGYKLYLHGITQGRSLVTIEPKMGRLLLSGMGPGLFCIFGAIVLVVALYYGGASVMTAQQQAQEQQMQLLKTVMDSGLKQQTSLTQQDRLLQSLTQQLQGINEKSNAIEQIRILQAILVQDLKNQQEKQQLALSAQEKLLKSIQTQQKNTFSVVMKNVKGASSLDGFDLPDKQNMKPASHETVHPEP